MARHWLKRLVVPARESGDHNACNVARERLLSTQTWSAQARAARCGVLNSRRDFEWATRWTSNLIRLRSAENKSAMNRFGPLFFQGRDPVPFESVTLKRMWSCLAPSTKNKEALKLPMDLEGKARVRTIVAMSRYLVFCCSCFVSTASAASAPSCSNELEQQWHLKRRLSVNTGVSSITQRNERTDDCMLQCVSTWTCRRCQCPQTNLCSNVPASLPRETL